MGNFMLYSEVENLMNRYETHSKINKFIETGTQYGITVFEMSKYFNECTTIELSEGHWSNAVNKADKENITNINFVLGDSSVKLKEVLKNTKESCVFFLDGHHCGKTTDVLATRGEIEVPLYEELKAINELHNFDSLIIIDDSRLIGKNLVTEDLNWSDITFEGLLSCIDKDKIVTSFEENDRFIIYIKKIKK